MLSVLSRCFLTRGGLRFPTFRPGRRSFASTPGAAGGQGLAGRVDQMSFVLYKPLEVRVK